MLLPMRLYSVLFFSLFIMGVFTFYHLIQQVSSKSKFPLVARVDHMDLGSINQLQPSSDLSLALRLPTRNDSNLSSIEETISVLRKVNPGNDWLVSFDAMETQNILGDLSTVGLSLVGQIPELGMVRFSIINYPKAIPVLQQFIESESLSPNYPLRQPIAPRHEEVFEGIEFSDSFIDWMGGNSIREGFGHGIKIALIDSGVDPSHPVLADVSIRQMNEHHQLQSEGSTGISHGTALASVIAGQTDTYSGVSPGSEILSYQVLDKLGNTDSYTVANAIVSAVHSGADIINLSLGGEAGSEVLREAVSYALKSGVPVVAAVGNDGQGLVNYPAVYDGVIGVTAVGTSGRIANFANFGEGVDVAAPGVGVLTAWGAEDMGHFSGTSVSAALVTGAIAAELSRQPDLTPSQLEDLLEEFSNDAEKPGFDAIAGHGILSLARLENKNNLSYTDPAFIGYHFEHLDGINSGTLPFQALIQNQGNTWLNGLRLELNYLGIKKSILLDNLAPGEIRAEQLFLQGSDHDGTIEVNACLNLPSGMEDNRLENNSRKSVLKF